MRLIWPEDSWHHAESMLHAELDQLSVGFPQSILLQAPAQTANGWIELVQEGWRARLTQLGQRADPPSSPSLHQKGFRKHVGTLLRRVSNFLQDYLLAAGFTVLTFLVRLLVLYLTLPLFFLAALVGLVDGLVRRDLRRFSAGRESGFLYHRARATLMPLTVLPWVVYLALPVSVSPLWILLPGAGLLSLAVNITAGSFKKYL
jgi:integrating conjugative element membrane protein (TIGR03747 family)